MLVTITGSTIHNNAQSTIKTVYNNDDLIKEISYEYKITESEYNGFHCYGNLNLSLNITDNIERLILERTTPHEPEDSSPKFLIKRDLSLDNHQSLQDIPWQTRFRICIHCKDGTREFSEIYNINDYIDDEDLKLLYESTSITIVQGDGDDITVDNGGIHLQAPGLGLLNVFDTSGRNIFSKIINESETLNIHDLNYSSTSTIIVKLQSTEKTIVKKIRIQ